MALQALKGNLSSSSGMFHGKALINNIGLNEKHNISGAEVNGTAITYGYPDLNYISGNIDDLKTMVDINSDDWFAMGDFTSKTFYVTLDTLAELRPAPNDAPSDRRVVDIILLVVVISLMSMRLCYPLVRLSHRQLHLSRQAIGDRC